MNTIKIIIHGTGTMSSILKNVIETEEDLEVSGFADDLTNEKGDIIIDFSHFSRIPNMLNFAVNNNIPIVICTTGYDDKILSQIKEASSKIPILLSSNTSIGINLMNDLVSKMAENLNGFDIEIIETHHNKKVDSPSGTAKTLFNAINQTLENKMNLINGREGNHKRDKNEIGIHSIRGGSVVGEHRVIFYGDDEAIEIKHSAMSKKIFVYGAIKAAKFLIGKKPNLYSMKDVLS
jgi:4-hydroxy-tetrahydrodipicolinate reductase